MVNKLKKNLIAVKRASKGLGLLNVKVRNSLLRNIATHIIRNRNKLLSANALDVSSFQGDVVLKERLELNEKKIKQIVSSILAVTKLSDPLGQVLETRRRPNGLRIKKISVPLGVLGVIYESRPNVTVDLSVLALKAGNGLVLKGGKESYQSNKVLVEIIQKALEASRLPKNLVYLVDPKIDWKTTLFSAHNLIDVLIPRGGQSLINFVRQHARIPVIETGAGVCHIFMDDYNIKKSVEIVVNAKIQRPSVCNSLDTLVISEKTAKIFLSALSTSLAEHYVEIFADAQTYRILKNFYPVSLLHRSKKEDFGKEFLSLKMSIKTVKNFKAGLEFVKKYSSGHSEAILTTNAAHARKFLQSVDAAVVYHNASIRFTDGGEFGMGAEVGISTQKLHARGPMGLETLTSYKWIVEGSGQIR